MNAKRLNAVLMGLLFIYVGFSLSSPSAESQENVYQNRRIRLMGKIEKGVLIMSADKHDADFFYLTGIEHGEAAMILLPEEQQFVLFIQPPNPTQSIWTEKSIGIEEAELMYKADQVFSLEEFEKISWELIVGKKAIFYPLDDDAINTHVLRIFKSPWLDWGKNIINPLPLIHKMRLVKDAHEIQRMKKAARITCDALKEVMKTITPGMHEYEVQALIEYVFRREGGEGPGFPSIIGSEENSTILHYESNTRKTEDGDLILMDVGADYQHYKADVTRTIPVSGTFTREQAEVYQVVLDSQKAAVDCIRPGRGFWEIHRKGVEVLKEGLFRIGLITDKNSEWQYRIWMMYTISHWLGLDVHDVGGRGSREGPGRLLQPGMVLTVEPGVYINERSLENIASKLGSHCPMDKKEIQDFIKAVGPAVEKYMNIGIRIEDDILVTEEGFENLSHSVPKEIRQIEDLMVKRKRIESLLIGLETEIFD